MDKPEGQEQGQTEFQICKNLVLRVSKKRAHKSVKGWQKSSVQNLGTLQATRPLKTEPYGVKAV